MTALSFVMVNANIWKIFQTQYTMDISVNSSHAQFMVTQIGSWCYSKLFIKNLCFLNMQIHVVYRTRFYLQYFELRISQWEYIRSQMWPQLVRKIITLRCLNLWDIVLYILALLFVFRSQNFSIQNLKIKNKIVVN